MIVSLAELAVGDTVALFEGEDHGAQVSLFAGSFPPGSGPPLHRHPYAETFVIQGGEATFTVDGAEVDAFAGEIVVVPAGAWHAFVAGGEVDLTLVSVHPSPRVVQERLGYAAADAARRSPRRGSVT